MATASRIRQVDLQRDHSLSCAWRARLAAAMFVSLAIVTVSGCAVVTIAGAAASVAATAASTVVDVGVGAVRVTGKVIGKGVDLVTSSPPAPVLPTRP